MLLPEDLFCQERCAAPELHAELHAGTKLWAVAVLSTTVCNEEGETVLPFQCISVTHSDHMFPIAPPATAAERGPFYWLGKDLSESESESSVVRGP